MYNLNFEMFSSVQIKQEYNSVDDKNHQNMVGEQSQIDYTVFDNQNVQYAYHQLPNLWDQALQVQSDQYPKDFSQKNDNNISHQDISKMNQIMFSRTTYLNHQLQQQNNFAINQQNINDQSLINQVTQINPESRHIESNDIPNIMNNNPPIDPMITAMQSSSTTVKCNTTCRPSKLPSTISSPRKKLKCQCEICFKEFGHKSNLFIHMRTHNGERPYKCKDCNKSFTHSGNLAIHMRTHSGERPYACQICGKMFSHSGNLSTHLRTHSGVKPYKCSVCSKEFRHSGNLSIHERIHSGIKPFQCKVCGKEFYHSGNLTTHMKKHPVTISTDKCKSNALSMLNNEYACNIEEVEETEQILNRNSSGNIEGGALNHKINSS